MSSEVILTSEQSREFVQSVNLHISVQGSPWLTQVHDGAVQEREQVHDMNSKIESGAGAHSIQITLTNPSVIDHPKPSGLGMSGLG